MKYADVDTLVKYIAPASGDEILKMKKILLVAFIAAVLSANAQRNTSGTLKIPAKKTSTTPAKTIAPVLKSLESLSDNQIANALYVEIGLDNYGGADDNVLKSYIKSSSQVVNIAEIIHNREKYYLVDRLCSDDCPYGNNRDSYEDKGNVRSTVANSPLYGDKGSGSNPWISRLNQEEVNKFRVSSRDKAPIELIASDISVLCQKEGDSFVEVLRIGYDLVSQYFIKGTHSYIISVDRSGKVTNIRSKDIIGNNQVSENYNICSERLIAKMMNFKFIDDLDAPTSRIYKIIVTAKTKNSDSDVVKFIHKEETYLSNSDPSRKFYTDSISSESKMNDVLKNLNLIESRIDSIKKSLVKKRNDIIEEFKTNYAAYVEKDRQRLIKEEWGGKLDPRTNSYDRTLDMILAQANANTREKFQNLESSTYRDVRNGLDGINQEYEEVHNIYIDLKNTYDSFKDFEQYMIYHQ